MTVTVTQKNPSGKLYGCKLDVEVSTATTSKVVGTVDLGQAPTTPTATTTVTVTEPVTGTVVDPGHRVISHQGPPGPVPPPEPPRKVWIL